MQPPCCQCTSSCRVVVGLPNDCIDFAPHPAVTLHVFGDLSGDLLAVLEHRVIFIALEIVQVDQMLQRSEEAAKARELKVSSRDLAAI